MGGGPIITEIYLLFYLPRGLICARHIDTEKLQTHHTADIHKCAGANLARSRAARQQEQGKHMVYARWTRTNAPNTHIIIAGRHACCYIFGWRKGERLALRLCVRAPNALRGESGDLDDSPGRFIDTVYVDEPHYSGQVGSTTLAQDKRAWAQNTVAYAILLKATQSASALTIFGHVKHQFLFISEYSFFLCLGIDSKGNVGRV